MFAFSRPLYIFYRILGGVICLILGGFAFYSWQTTPTSLFTLAVSILLALYWGASFWSVPSMLTGDWEKSQPRYIWSWKPSLLTLVLVVALEIIFYFINLLVWIITVFFVAPAYASAALATGVIVSFLVTFAHAVGMVRITIRMRKTGTQGFLGVLSELLNR